MEDDLKTRGAWERGVFGARIGLVLGCANAVEPQKSVLSSKAQPTETMSRDITVARRCRCPAASRLTWRSTPVQQAMRLTRQLGDGQPVGARTEAALVRAFGTGGGVVRQFGVTLHRHALGAVILEVHFVA